MRTTLTILAPAEREKRTYRIMSEDFAGGNMTASGLRLTNQNDESLMMPEQHLFELLDKYFKDRF